MGSLMHRTLAPLIQLLILYLDMKTASSICVVYSPIHGADMEREIAPRILAVDDVCLYYRFYWCQRDFEEIFGVEAWPMR